MQLSSIVGFRRCAAFRGYIVICMVALLTGCKDLITSSVYPAGTQDPASYQTPAGALAFAEGTVNLLQVAAPEHAIFTGQLSDELTSVLSPADSLNARRMPEALSNDLERVTDDDYTVWQRIRGQARIARGLLGAYPSAGSQVATAKMYAIEGYADIALAEFFCSGVPLTTVDFAGDYTYKAGSTSAEVYTAAAALFDSALALVGDSAALQTFARVGKGRALLGLGQYANAAQAVAEVPDSSSYAIRVLIGATASSNNAFPRYSSVTDQEGIHGLNYVSSHDPRTTIIAIPADPFFGTTAISFPAKYAYTDSTPFVLGDFIEARLIQAEAALHANNASWLTTLNTLRTTGVYTEIDTVIDAIDSSVTPSDTLSHIDTAWVAGTGGVGHLGVLQDPGIDSARVSLVFRERAFWMFLTGHRQGDLRRLVRQYARPQNTVYPTGSTAPGLGAFGFDVTAPIPHSERHNPLYHGCLNRDA